MYRLLLYCGDSFARIGGLVAEGAGFCYVAGVAGHYMGSRRRLHRPVCTSRRVSGHAEIQSLCGLLLLRVPRLARGLGHG